MFLIFKLSNVSKLMNSPDSCASIYSKLPTQSQTPPPLGLLLSAEASQQLPAHPQEGDHDILFQNLPLQLAVTYQTRLWPAGNVCFANQDGCLKGLIQGMKT